MKKSRFSEEQIIGILREAQSGGGVKAVCAKHNITGGEEDSGRRLGADGPSLPDVGIGTLELLSRRR